MNPEKEPRSSCPAVPARPIAATAATVPQRETASYANGKIFKSGWTPFYAYSSPSAYPPITFEG